MVIEISDTTRHQAGVEARLMALRARKEALGRAIQSLEQLIAAAADPYPRIEDMEAAHILLLEDTHVAARQVAEALSLLEYPHSLTRAESAGRALELLADCERFSRRNPDLILIDLHMARHNGFDVLTFLKETPRYRMIPVVFLAGSGEKGDVYHAYDLHANAVVDKGQTLEDLRQALDVVCRMWLKVAVRPRA